MAWSESSAPGLVSPMPTLPAIYALPVVVAPPFTVRPPDCVPSPIVEDALKRSDAPLTVPVSVGDPAKTAAPVPVSSVSAAARLADDGVPHQVAMPVPIEVRPVPPLPTDNCVPDQLLLLMVESVAREPRPVTCVDGSERFGSVVIPEIEEDAESLLSKRPLKVVV